MGLAANRSRLAVGTVNGVHYFRNMPTVCRYLDPPERHDACYLTRPRSTSPAASTSTMAWVGEELWFVNTRFSCLCTLDGIHGTAPRWRPSFVAPWRRRTAVISTAWVCGMAGSASPRPWPPPIRRRAGGSTRRMAASCWTCRPPKCGAPRSVNPHSPRSARSSTPVGVGVGPGRDRPRGHGGRPLRRDRRAARFHARPGLPRPPGVRGTLAGAQGAVFSGIPVADRNLGKHNCGVWVVDVRSDGRRPFRASRTRCRRCSRCKCFPGCAGPRSGRTIRSFSAAPTTCRRRPCAKCPQRSAMLRLPNRT